MKRVHISENKIKYQKKKKGLYVFTQQIATDIVFKTTTCSSKVNSILLAKWQKPFTSELFALNRAC